MGVAEDALNKANIAALLARLDELGWKDGHNLRTDVRWWAGGPEQMQSVVADMLSSSPDVAIAATNLALAVLKPVAGNVPVVFLGVGDPVGSGFVASLAHPGGNITGFATYDGPMGAKWLEVLKQTAPHLTRILTIPHAETPINQKFWHSIQDAAPRFGVEVTPGGVHDGSEIEKAITAFAVKENSGLIVLPHAVTNVNRELIVALALRHSLPAIDAIGNANVGGLVSYGADTAASYPQAAEYVDRILRGQKPSDLPVQQPTKFILTFNLRTARVIGLELPHNLLVLADKVIE
jgi:putative ABC transport system substrate-binding protein